MSGDGQPGEGGDEVRAPVGPGRRWGSQDLWDTAREAGAGVLSKGSRRVVGPIGVGENRQKVSPGQPGEQHAHSPQKADPPVGSSVLPADLPAEGSVDQA